MIPGSQGNHPSFKRSFLIAFQGLRTAWATERNIKVMVMGGIGALMVSALLRLDALSWALVLLCSGLVFWPELFNTAIETVVDLVSPEFHPLAGRAKDIAAAASWIVCATAAIVGIIVFGRAILLLFA